jgi:zinc transport system substrate-binding protein
MKNFFYVFIYPLFIFFLISQKLYAFKVIVTIEPQRYFFSKIAEDIAEPVVLVPAGANLHTFELKPSQIKEIAGANIYFTIGDPVEISLKNKIKALNKDIKIIETDANIPKIPMEDHDHGHEHHHSHELNNLDPHIWLSPALAKIIARNMLDGLISVYPDHSDIYRKNFDRFMKEIDGLNSELTEILKNISQPRIFLVFHPSWGYFARDYNLIQLSVEYKGREPSPKKLAEIMNTAKHKGIKTIFIQPQISSRTAQIIAKEIGAQVVTADPLAFNWHENLREIAIKIKNAE